VEAEQVDVLAFYLPQFHPIPENDAWWGRGFTEWTNVVRARPRIKGQYQPHLPGELGFYDLRLPEVRRQQADLAREHGISAFVYYHYWFNGRRVLERPIEEVLASGEPDFPFALCWANENWTRAWDGGPHEVLLKQDYDPDDDLRHIQSLLPAFRDPRYHRVDGKPLFLVYRASLLPDVERTLELWRAEARRAGIGELYLARIDGHADEARHDPHAQGFDAAIGWIPDFSQQGNSLRRGGLRLWGISRKLRLTSRAYERDVFIPYERIVRNMLAMPEPSYRRHPCVTPAWDNSARRQTGAFVAMGSTPTLYGEWLEAIVRRVRAQANGPRLVFVNAWNEWAEGNHLEPDRRWGRQYLEATRDALARALTPPR
jgi:lipopolysaccharide biosynthesis protein